MAAPQKKLDALFEGTRGDRWKSFAKDVKSRAFLEALANDPRADEKLRAFSSAVHLRATDKVPVTKVRGEGGTYQVRYHPSTGRHSCTCGDWTYKKSIDGGECKHIRSVSGRVKMASPALLALGRILSAEHLHQARQKDRKKHEASFAKMKELL